MVEDVFPRLVKIGRTQDNGCKDRWEEKKQAVDRKSRGKPDMQSTAHVFHPKKKRRGEEGACQINDRPIAWPAIFLPTADFPSSF